MNLHGSWLPQASGSLYQALNPKGCRRSKEYPKIWVGSMIDLNNRLPWAWAVSLSLTEEAQLLSTLRIELTHKILFEKNDSAKKKRNGGSLQVLPLDFLSSKNCCEHLLILHTHTQSPVKLDTACVCSVGCWQESVPNALTAVFIFSLPDRKFLTWSQTNTYLNFWRQNLGLEQQGMTEFKVYVCFFILNHQGL